MKELCRRSAAALVLAVAVVPVLPEPAAAQPSDANAVRAANTAYYVAFAALDMVGMEALWVKSPEATAIHPFSRTPLVGWEAVRSSYVDTFTRFKDVSVSGSPALVSVNERTAWVVSTETLRGHRPNGEAFTAVSMSTNVFQKQGERWMMVLHHAAAVPQ